MIVMKLLEKMLEYFNKPIKGTLTVNFQKDKSMSFRNVHALEIMSIVRKFVEDTGHNVISFTYDDIYYSISITSTDREATLKSELVTIPIRILIELSELCRSLNVERVKVV